jgi:hypothetical protein
MGHPLLAATLTTALLALTPLPSPAQSPDRQIRLTVSENLRPCFRDAQIYGRDALRDFSVGDRLRVSLSAGPSSVEIDAPTVPCETMFGIVEDDFITTRDVRTARFATLSLWLVNTEIPRAILLAGSAAAREEGDRAFSLVYLAGAAEFLHGISEECGVVDWQRYYGFDVCGSGKARALVGELAGEMLADLDALEGEGSAMLAYLRERAEVLSEWAAE